MDEQAEQRLAAFARAANKSLLHEEDWRRFYEFTIYIHRLKLPITGKEVTNHLFGHGFASEQAVQLGGQFERFRDLLTLYD